MLERLKRVVGFMRAPRVESTSAATHECGLRLLERGYAVQAETCFRSALDEDAAQADVLCDLSSALNLQGRFAAAEDSSRAALSLNPALPGAHVNLANSMLYRGRYGEAIGYYVDALRIDSALPEAHIHLALLGRPTPHLSTAIGHFEERLRRQPDSYMALTRLGLAYQATGRIEAAREHFEKAGELQPKLGGPLASLAVLYGIQGCPEPALALFRKALTINENPIWRSAYLFFLQYSDRLSAADIYREHVSWGERHVVAAESRPRFANTTDPQRKLRIGYMSGDFFQHPVAHFFEPILRCHDRRQFEIHCYANVLSPDEATERLKALCDEWIDTIAMSDMAVCQKIRDDGIDILIDLSGHTKGQRTGVLAGKAAPVQATYLGYPSTTGLAAVDYRISDAISDPPGVTDRLYAEKLLRLDGCFVTYLPPTNAPAVDPSPVLTKGYVTFGSFNNINKVNRLTIGLWAEVLQAVPGSRIAIKHFATCYEEARTRIFDAFAECGIDAGRVQLLAAQPELASHLGLYREIDIALDCTPYNGTTTTCEAMWMGVPVLTLAGDRHAARVGASLLACVGLDDLVATTPEDYVKAAIELAADGERLRYLRQTLRRDMMQSPLLDARRFTGGLETAYRTVWRVWCETGGDNTPDVTSKPPG